MVFVGLGQVSNCLTDKILLCLWIWTYKRQPAVVASANLGLVGVDEDPGMSGRAAATVASNGAIVRPRYFLLVDELNGRIGLWLHNCYVSLWFPILLLRSVPASEDRGVCRPHLQAEVSLLESGARHGFGAWALGAGPKFGPVRGLGGRSGSLTIDDLGGGLGLRGWYGVELAGGYGKRAPAGGQLARQLLSGAQSRGGDHGDGNWVVVGGFAERRLTRKSEVARAQAVPAGSSADPRDKLEWQERINRLPALLIFILFCPGTNGPH